MTTIDQWIDASIDTTQNSLDCLKEVRWNPDRLIVQARALKHHIDSFVDFLERQNKSITTPSTAPTSKPTPATE